MAANLVKLTDRLHVLRDGVNVGIIRDSSRAVLIEIGDGSALAALRSAGIDRVEAVLFTHHHRDSACGARACADAGAQLIAPRAEKQWFADVQSYWDDPSHRWHLYDFHPHHLMLAESVPVARTLAPGDVFSWGPARVRALATPGHTDGSLTYLVDVDGQRVAFTGDLIYSSGRIYELHSLQKATATVDEYHGFLGGQPTHIASLKLVREAGPHMLVPAHGEIIHEPSSAIDDLIGNLQEHRECYAEVSALRYYSPGEFAHYEGSSLMPMGQSFPFPDCLQRLCGDTTLVLTSRTGAAFVMDCHRPEVVDELRRMLSTGEIKSVDGLWITHYHDDHVDGVPAFQDAFGCETIADESVAQIITNPLAWRLPCISPLAAQVDRRTSDGDAWQWHEYTMTAFHFPGQTFHHGGLLVEGNGLRMFFVGDSFTPSGMDDYCVYNRNFVGREIGLDRCLAILQALQPEILFNPHVELGFSFSAEQYAAMRENLVRRREVLAKLLPWDDPNLGIDDQWVFCHPYEQHVRAGDRAALDLVATNHCDSAGLLAAQLTLPAYWRESELRAQVLLPPSCCRQASFGFRVPEGTGPGRYAVPVSVTFRDTQFPQIAEAVIMVD
jgi:glyoxylase-like metal-dependent hydrolase (beta-lactamase superfamily II)